MKTSHTRQIVTCVALASALALLVACRGGGKSLSSAMKSVSNDQLAIMVLPKEELGADAADLPVDPSAGAGFIDSASWAETSPDPDDTASDVEAAGYVNGYELSYADYSGAHAVLEFDSGVQLYKTEDNASASLAKFLNDFKSAEGNDQYQHTNIAVADESGIGDEAQLLTANFAWQDDDSLGATSGIIFRIGRIVGFVSENRSDDADTTGNSRAAAKAMAKRIKAVLKGDLQETPVPIPSEEETAALQIQGVLDQIAAAYNGKDIDGYLAFWTDNGLQGAFGATRDEERAALGASMGEPPLEFKNVTNVDLSVANGAAFDVDVLTGSDTRQARITIVDDGNGPRIDGFEDLGGG